MPNEPPAVDVLEKNPDMKFAHKLLATMQVIHWPGQPGYTPPPPPRLLTEAEQQRYESGRTIYTATCAQCHKPDGLGQDGLAPPLIDSEWAVGSADGPVRIVLHGLRGPINVGGRAYNLEMPALRLLSDQQIADALTYVRRSWDHGADPVTAEMVTKIRSDTQERQDPWTAGELNRLSGSSRGGRANR
jgi:mono/diheme cytochrome c family protein